MLTQLRALTAADRLSGRLFPRGPLAAFTIEAERGDRLRGVSIESASTL
jgi:hypothetical protein